MSSAETKDIKQTTSENPAVNLESVMEVYKADPRVAQLVSELQQEEVKTIHTSGLVGSSPAFVVAGTFASLDANHIVVLNEKESAGYFHNDLKNVMDGKDILFFPDSFKKPGRFEELNNQNISLRTETVNRLTFPRSKGEIIVTYPEALFEKVVDSKHLRKNTLRLTAGEKIDIDFITELLVEYSFNHADFVYEPGQFSIRGGIVDIFSFANDYPYRIELFDDEVDTIRTFDPTTQLSVKKINRVTIVPNIQTHFEEQQKVPLFELLKPNTIVWMQDRSLVQEVLNKLMQSASALQVAADQLPLNHPLREGDAEDLFLGWNEINNALNTYRNVHFSGSKQSDENALAFNIKPQPSFNKNFEMVIKAFEKNDKDGIKTYLFAENPKQIERFYHIFEDLNAKVDFHPVNRVIHQGFLDEDLNLTCYTDHQIFNRYHKYSIKRGFSRDQALILKTLKELKPGDYITHIDHGVGVYQGLEKLDVNGQKQEAVRILYHGGDLLYVGINSLHKISKFTGKEGHQPKVNKLGSDAWSNLKRRTKKKIKDIAADLIKLYAKRKAQKGFAFSPDTYLQTELEASFIYEDTPDQFKATGDVKEDMQREIPMDRLVCGDVGFGKTEVAIRAAFKAVADSKQVAILVPTTILAMQHYKTFSERLADFPCKVDYVNRFKTTAEKKATIQALKEGKVDILVGTHAIVGKDIAFKDLGLLIIDEEQKFGVAVKDKLKQLRVNVDTLTLTATPIPRTLQFSLLGARDLSIINTPPPNRQPVTTEVHEFDPEVLKEAIEFEVYRGGQVFFVHNRVKDIMDIKAMINKIVPNIDIAVAHGQMEGKALEKVMMEFMSRKYDVLLCTNIIESGLDIPNANTIIINNANNFGLSDLHQLRGRVGRSNKKAFCYLFRPPLSTLTIEARQRLRTIEEFAEIGSGFHIAMRDLDIRGAGNLLGGEQSGFITDIGYDMYHKILDEAILELKHGEFKDLYKDSLEKEDRYITDTQVDTDLEMLIPDQYVNNINERMALYGEINNAKNEEQLQGVGATLIDRFGPLPKEVLELFNAIRLKWIAISLGIERIILKNGKLRCYFPENQESPYYESARFGRILKYIQGSAGEYFLKQTNGKLILSIEKVRSMKSAHHKLDQLKLETEPASDKQTG